ncbi:hypothetical protein GCM10010916_37140 [Paenibacillus abyssi]|uniref:Uncharacterized protein n=1 Tax=Paenibacillus abyssi TaxID=1340531 RepID=A0A917G0U7_9BACL|nr:hypothetical protein GCM10010916_37140 [Paenibacillus abyssi]
MTQEEVLKGGNVNHIVRKENTVLPPLVIGARVFMSYLSI